MTKDLAKSEIANIMLNYLGETARKRLKEEAKFAKQSVDEMAFRMAGNLIESLTLRKPGGYV